MKEIIGVTSVLCQALQQHFQDLLNAMHLVSTTKSLIQELRDDGWEPLLASVISFCEQHEIDIPDMMLFFWEPFFFFSFFLFLGIELAQMKLDELVEDVMNLDINKESMVDNRGHS